MRTLTFFSALNLLLIAPQTRAAEPAATQSYPLKITNIAPIDNDSYGDGLVSGNNAHGKDGRMFVIKTQNLSGKHIQGMKFQSAYLDATEDSTDLPAAWNWTDALKTADEKFFRSENSWTAESRAGWRVRLVQVLSEDDTQWEPGTDQTCGGEFWHDKHHKQI